MNHFNKANDQFWTWGLFYNNPNDKSIWVKKRYGIGWTLNYGQRTSYYITAGFLAVIALVFLLK